LRSKLKTGNAEAARHTRRCTQLDGVGAVLVHLCGERAQRSRVRPAAGICQIASVCVVVERRRGHVQGRVWEWIIAVLLSGVAEVVGAVTITVKVIREQPSTASRGREHSTSIVAHVDQVDSVAVGASWVRARDRERLDEVEEALVAVPSSRSGCTS